MLKLYNHTLTDAMQKIQSRFDNGTLSIPDAAYIEREEWEEIMEDFSNRQYRCSRFGGINGGKDRCEDLATHGLYCQFHFEDGCRRTAAEAKIRKSIMEASPIKRQVMKAYHHVCKFFYKDWQ